MNSLYGSYRTRKFTDIWPSFEDFRVGYSKLPYRLKIINNNEYMSELYYLLYAYYGNSHIASSDENQFKYRLYSTIYMYWGDWMQRRKIQDKLRNMDLEGDDILKGTSAIYNHANNPTAGPLNDTDEALKYVNDQNTTQYKRSRIDALGNLYMLLDRDVTKEFINRFRPLFLTVVEPQEPLWYITNDEEDEE